MFLKTFLSWSGWWWSQSLFQDQGRNTSLLDTSPFQDNMSRDIHMLIHTQVKFKTTNRPTSTFLEGGNHRILRKPKLHKKSNLSSRLNLGSWSSEATMLPTVPPCHPLFKLLSLANSYSCTFITEFLSEIFQTNLWRNIFLER